jgi:hypothetical protein
MTVAINSAQAPDGQMTADTLTASGSPGVHKQTFATIAAATWTWCVWLKRNGAADVAGDIRLVKNSANTQIALTAVTATSAWQRFCVSGTAVVNDTRVETRITTSANSMYWWGGQLTQTAAWASLYCPTTTALATCNAVTSSYVAAANIASWTRAQGTIASVQFKTDPTPGLGHYFGLYNGSDNTGRITDNDSFQIYNSSAVAVQVAATTSSAATAANNVTGFVHAFDSTGAFYGTRRYYGQTFQSSYAGPSVSYSTDSGANWTPATGTILHFGSTAGGAPINGPTQTVSIYTTR